MLDGKIMISVLVVWCDLSFSKAFILVFQVQETTNIAVPCERSNKSITHGYGLHRLIDMILTVDVHLTDVIIYYFKRVHRWLCKFTWEAVEHFIYDNLIL